MIQDVIANVGERIRNLETEEFWGWQPIAEIELTGAAANVTFSNIPPNYRSLALMIQSRTDRATEEDTAALRFNGDGGNNYDRIFKYFNTGTGSTGGVNIGLDQIYVAHGEATNSRADNWPATLVYIPGYARSDREKWAFSSSSGGFGNVDANADMWIFDYRGRWRSTAVIASVLIRPVTGPNFVAGSAFELYGML